jgi:Phosphotransferase enzyme family
LPETIPAIREEVSRQLFGAANVQWERVRQGVSTRVYRIDQRGERYYLRILPELGATFAAEVRAHRLARELECRVPEVLHYEPCNELLGRSVILTGEITGRPLSIRDDPAVIRDGVRLTGIDLATQCLASHRQL